MTRCDAYWNKVRQLLAEGDKDALYDFCGKNPRTVADITDHVAYMDRQIEKSTGGEISQLVEKSLSAGASLPLRKLERQDPILHDIALSEVCKLERPTAKAVRDTIREVKVERNLMDNHIEPREDIVHDSIENLLDYLDPESVDLILTDPPYPAEFLPLWDVLAEKAAVVLKPSGFLISYSGHFHLPQVFASLSKHLEYVWTLALVHSGAHQGVFPRRMHAAWKPILIYCKPPYEPQPEWMSDVIQGSGMEKQDHEWQQALGEAEELITRFSRPNALVVDPFLGSGTVVLAARNTGRSFFGMDIDELSVKTTLGRIAA